MRSPEALVPSSPEPRAGLQRLRGQLAWKVNRLRCMTPAEVAHRTARLLQAQVAKRGWIRASAPPAPAFRTQSRSWVHLPALIDPKPYLAAADRYLEDRVDLFAWPDVELGTPPRWNRDPRTGIVAPLEYGMLLDYRDSRRVGDCKFVWEANRHLHFVTLAQAHALTGRRAYGETIVRHLLSWIEACPPRLGINWASANEAALRLINWSVAWQLLGGLRSPVFDGEVGERLRGRWLSSVHEQARFIREHFSRYSSANNHLIGEAAGLFIAALTWPHWPEAAHWRREAQAILETEILRQNAPDGVNLEQSVSYQQYELDLLLFCALAAEANQVPMAETFRPRLSAMMDYLASVMDSGGNAPMIGDSDDGCVVRFFPEEPFCRYRSVLATGAILLSRGDLKAKAGPLDDKTRWLIGPAADAIYAALPEPRDHEPPRRAFPQGGYYILGTDFEGPEEIRVVADAGPLGYQTIAAHGHADALAFTLSVGGREFLVDPGTYAYHTKPEWRRYFRGTSAHNTVRIDGQDQSEQGGNFLWLRKARAQCRLWSSTPALDIFEGRHDGYRALADPVVHSRRITLDKAARRIVVQDELAMDGEHDVEIFFHPNERCRVDAAGRVVTLAQPGRVLVMELPEGGAVSVHRGETHPPLGWVSRRFDCREPTSTVVWRARVRGGRRLRTTIDC